MKIVLLFLLLANSSFASTAPITVIDKPATATKKIEGLGLSTQPMVPPKPIESCQKLSNEITFYRCETSEVICYIGKPAITCWAKSTK